MAHYAFYFLLLVPDAVHAFCNKRAMLRYPALVRRDAVNELRGCVTYNQRSKWGPATTNWNETQQHVQTSKQSGHA